MYDLMVTMSFCEGRGPSAQTFKRLQAYNTPTCTILSTSENPNTNRTDCFGIDSALLSRINYPVVVLDGMHGL